MAMSNEDKDRQHQMYLENDLSGMQSVLFLMGDFVTVLQLPG